MATSDTAVASGASQNPELRRRNVAGAEKDKRNGGTQVPTIEIDGKKVAVRKVCYRSRISHLELLDVDAGLPRCCAGRQDCDVGIGR